MSVRPSIKNMSPESDDPVRLYSVHDDEASFVVSTDQYHLLGLIGLCAVMKADNAASIASGLRFSLSSYIKRRRGPNEGPVR